MFYKNNGIHTFACAAFLQVLVDWGAPGSVHTGADDLDSFVEIAQTEGGAPRSEHKDYIDADVFVGLLSGQDFQASMWPEVASSLFAMIDSDSSGRISVRDLFTFMRSHGCSVEEGDLVSPAPPERGTPPKKTPPLPWP